MSTSRFDYVRSIAGISLAVHGTVTVEYPRASIKVDVSAPLNPTHTYNLRIEPGHLKDEQTHSFTLVPVTIAVEVRPKAAQILVKVTVAGFDAYSYPFSFDDPKGAHTIRAYGVPIFIPELGKHADHTYAVATNDKTGAEITWKCGGGYQNGRLLATGHGDALLCDCISERKQPDPLALGGLAGIRYAIDGVCHQITNRILYSVGMEVTQANAYQASVHMYGRLGTYAIDGIGRKYWDALQSRCKASPRAAGAPGATETAPTAAETRAEHTASALYDLQQQTEGALTQTQADGMVEELTSALATRDRVSAAMSEGSIDGRELAMRMNSAATTYLAAAARIVPIKIFGRVFGVQPGEEVLLVNPQVAEQVYRKGMPEQFKREV